MKIARGVILLSLMIILAILVSVSFRIGVCGEKEDQMSRWHNYHIQKIQAIKDSLVLPAPAPAPAPVPPVTSNPRVYHVTSYGADPSGKTDSTEAILRTITDALNGPSDGSLIDGIVNLGGAQIHLQGGSFLISRPLKFPVSGRGNLMIHGGTLKASNDFPLDEYLLDLSTPPIEGSSYNYEFITFRNLLLDSNYRGGGIKVVNSLRTNIDNCYITHFTTDGIIAQAGHETYIRNSFLGQHITAGSDPNERDFSGTAINLMGNDNAVTDVVIFSAAIGIMVTGQANMISGVHCYNKATYFGGIGIYLRLPGLTQTRIVNSYLDFTGIVAEDPVQLHISNCLFLGDAYILLKSVNGLMNGVNIVDNMFTGSNKGVDIVQLDQGTKAFSRIDQVVVDRNNVKDMNLKATVARGNVEGNGTIWVVDLSRILVFPDLIMNVQYTLRTNATLFPRHALRNVTNNRVLIETDEAIAGNVFVVADQGRAHLS